MKRKIETQKITITGLMIGLGLLIPYVTSHAFGMKGTVFLPMHYTVFLTGFLCGPICGAIAGLVLPLISSILTGMPAFFPMLPVMMCELLIYGWMTGMIYGRKKLGIYGTMISSMLAGRIVHGVVFALLMLAGNTPVTFASAAMFVVEGIPGTLLQLIIIPPIVKVLTRVMCNTASSMSGRSEERKKDSVMEEAKALIHAEQSSFVVIKDGSIVYRDKGNGVKPILKLLETDREFLKDVVVVDKIIGKAAALLLTLGGVRGVYGITMSRAAKEYLENVGIDCGSDKCIDVISNRQKDGICPLERAVSDVDDPEEAYKILKKTIAQLMKSAG